MSDLDPRLFAYRDDIAANYLKERIRVPKYSDGELRQVSAPSVSIRATPRFDAPVTTEALSGETLTLYDIKSGWGWGQLTNDRYVGYVPLDALSTNIEENTHRVSARLTYLYPAPDIKTPPITKMSFSCTVLPLRADNRFIELSRGGYIFADHLVGIRDRVKDFVRVAERFVGAPYLWGGKSTLGIDCSGLVQIAMNAAGITCPRDSDMQLAAIGDPINTSKIDEIQRGDLLFWSGHVALAQSSDWMVHASGHHMEVVVEPIRRAIERIAETYGPLKAIKRYTSEQTNYFTKPGLDRPSTEKSAIANTAGQGKAKTLEKPLELVTQVDANLNAPTDTGKNKRETPTAAEAVITEKVRSE